MFGLEETIHRMLARRVEDQQKAAFIDAVETTPAQKDQLNKRPACVPGVVRPATQDSRGKGHWFSHR